MTVRRAPRITAAIGVIVVDGERSTACMTRNVSLTGVFLLTKERWSPDTIVRLEIIRDGERFAVQGQVKFAADDGVALAFHQPTADFTAKFGGFLEDLVKRRPEHDIDVANVLGWRPLNRVSPPPLPSRASLSSLTLDGAAVDTATPPEVGQEILVFVDGHADGQLLESAERSIECRAEVVRHTQSGFAMRFVQPSRKFRAAVTQLRRAHRH